MGRKHLPLCLLIGLSACACRHSGGHASSTAEEVFGSARRGMSEDQIVDRFGPPTARTAHVLTYISGDMAVDLTFNDGKKLQDVGLHHNSPATIQIKSSSH